jgi:hypothetical protein
MVPNYRYECRSKCGMPSLRSRQRLSLVLALSLWGLAAVGLAERGYRPGTPPWVPVIDDCMAAGGNRNDCIEALPPDLYAGFLEWERGPEWRRGADILKRSRIPAVPPAEAIAAIFRSPLAVPSMRADVAAELARGRCLIPHDAKGEPAIAVGEFAAPGQEDIAVICSIDGESRIRILWGGPASCPEPGDVRPDGVLIYRSERWQYLWRIEAVPPETVRRRYELYPEECPAAELPPLEHSALADIRGEQAPVSLYCHLGRWRRLCGVN